MGIDITEFLAQLGRDKDATELVKAVGDLTLIAFYYFLGVGEYTINGSRNNTKQIVHFKLEYAIFPHKDKQGHLRLFPINTTGDEIIIADGTILKFDNHKNYWKGVCVFKDHNEDEEFSLVRALGRRRISICNQTINRKTFLLDFWVDGKQRYVTAENISSSLNSQPGN